MDWLRKAAAVPVSPVTARGGPLVDEPTDPIGPPDAGDAPQRHDDITAESTEPAADEEGRSLFARFGGRPVLLPLACVAALLVGFGSVTAVMKLTDRPAQSDAKPVPTAPPSAPATTTVATTAPRTPAVQSEPLPPAPEPTPAAEPAPAPAPQAGAS